MLTTVLSTKPADHWVTDELEVMLKKNKTTPNKKKTIGHGTDCVKQSPKNNNYSAVQIFRNIISIKLFLGRNISSGWLKP